MSTSKSSVCGRKAVLRDLLFVSSIFQSGTARKSDLKPTREWGNSTGKPAELGYAAVPGVVIAGA